MYLANCSSEINVTNISDKHWGTPTVTCNFICIDVIIEIFPLITKVYYLDFLLYANFERLEFGANFGHKYCF